MKGTRKYERMSRCYSDMGIPFPKPWWYGYPLLILSQWFELGLQRMPISLGFWEWGWHCPSSPQSPPVLFFDHFMTFSFPVFISYTLNVTMDLDRAEIKCSNKNLKINWFVKRCNIGPVWELLTPGYGLLPHLTHHESPQKSVCWYWNLGILIDTTTSNYWIFWSKPNFIILKVGIKRKIPI